MYDERTLDQLRDALPAVVAKIAEPDPRAGRNMYKCPLCRSGNEPGRNHDGAFSVYGSGRRWKCFACGKGGDVFSLIGEYEHIPDFTKQVERAAALSGISLNTKKTEYTRVIEYTEKKVAADEARREESRQKIREYVARCRTHAGETDYFGRRGLDAATVERFGLGFDPEKKVIVIPYGKDGAYYVTRSTEGKQFRKPKTELAGPEPIYNRAALYAGKPCFVCESQLDAISLIEAGAGICEAVAVGGSGVRKLTEQLKERGPAGPIILSFDNDEAGKKTTEEAAADLAMLNIPYTVAAYTLDAYPEDKRKDANDYLQGNRPQLEKDIAANVSAATLQADAERAERLAAHKAITGASRLAAFVNGIKDSANTPVISTGFPNLNAELDGGLYPGLYIVGAISSLGKTTLLLQIADQIAMYGHDVLYFSLEMAASELISKSVSRLTWTLCDGNTRNAKTARGITTASRYQNYDDAEINLINAALQEYATFSDHLFIYEGIGDIGAAQIRDAVQEHKDLTGKTPVVFIDYLQILAPNDPRASDKQNVDKCVLELKRISRDFGAPVVAVSSFNRDNYTTEVNMSAFKESGAIEYGSDVLLAMQPQGMQRGASNQAANAQLVNNCKRAEVRSVELKILKNRNGRTGGSVGFQYHALFNCFVPDEQHAAFTEEPAADLPAAFL